MNHSARGAQRGATLLISMIFLVIITLMVVSAVKVSTLNTRMVGNMQGEKEAEAAAQQGIEALIGTDFTQLPTATQETLDVGQSGASYAVNVAAPVCTGVKAIKLSELDAANTADQPCFVSGAQQDTGVSSGSGGNSLCSNSMWDLSATATPPNTTTPIPAVHQGVAQRVAVGADC